MQADLRAPNLELRLVNLPNHRILSIFSSFYLMAVHPTSAGIIARLKCRVSSKARNSARAVILLTREMNANRATRSNSIFPRGCSIIGLELAMQSGSHKKVGAQCRVRCIIAAPHCGTRQRSGFPNAPHLHTKMIRLQVHSYRMRL